jgi:hypothetical protein
MAMLAEVVEVARRGRHPQAHPHRGGRGRGHRRRGQPSHRAGHPGWHPQLLRFATRQPGRRVWAIEGTGGYGAGPTRSLAAHAEPVVELDRPSGPPAGTAPSPTRWMPPGRPARCWAATSSPAPSDRAARRVVGAAGRSPLGVQGVGDANASSTRWSSPRHRPCGNGSAQSVQPVSWCHLSSDPRRRPTATGPGQDPSRAQTLPGPLRRPPALPTPRERPST